MKYGRNGISENTPKSIVFGAGTIHRDLNFSEGAWNFEDSIVGATKGGSKFSIVPEVTQVQVDGAWVKVAGLNVKTGETAKLEVNFTELTEDVIKASTLGTYGEIGMVPSDLGSIVSKPDISEGDYWENIAFVGKTASGDNIIVLMANALCTSGLEIDNKDKESAAGTFTFECHASLDDDGEYDTLPWLIAYPANKVV